MSSLSISPEITSAFPLQLNLSTPTSTSFLQTFDKVCNPLVTYWRSIPHHPRRYQSLDVINFNPSSSLTIPLSYILRYETSTRSPNSQVYRSNIVKVHLPLLFSHEKCRYRSHYPSLTNFHIVVYEYIQVFSLFHVVDEVYQCRFQGAFVYQ